MRMITTFDFTTAADQMTGTALDIAAAFCVASNKMGEPLAEKQLRRLSLSKSFLYN
jgi:hypothetical protein